MSTYVNTIRMTARIFSTDLHRIYRRFANRLDQLKCQYLARTRSDLRVVGITSGGARVHVCASVSQFLFFFGLCSHLSKIIARASCARLTKGYSYRRATIGSTRMAGRAGMQTLTAHATRRTLSPILVLVTRKLCESPAQSTHSESVSAPAVQIKFAVNTSAQRSVYL
jgi:hypothetical protein